MGSAGSDQLLDDSAIAAKLAGMNWVCSRSGATATLERTFLFEDFVAAFAFMTMVAEDAEALDHHPEWRNVWNRVDVALTTHSANGITDLDFQLAHAIDRASAKCSMIPSHATDGCACALRGAVGDGLVPSQATS